MSAAMRMLMLDLLGEDTADENEVDGAARCALVIDDDPQIRRLLVRRLEPFFDGVIEAANAGDAEERIRNRRVTHVVSDYRLGGDEPTGADVIAALRRRRPGIERAVLLTASDVARQPLPEGVDAVVSKADGVDALIRALRL